MVSIELDAGAIPPESSAVAKLHGFPLVGVLPAVRGDPLGFFVRTGAGYGDAVELSFGLDRAFAAVEAPRRFLAPVSGVALDPDGHAVPPRCQGLEAAWRDLPFRLRACE